MTDDAPRLYRSNEELAMRALIVPRLRAAYPGARIVHELSVRYSTNRIDLAAICPDEIVAVEIKSSVDVAERLEAQLRAFAPIASRLIVALAPKWNELIDIASRLRVPSHPRSTHLFLRDSCAELLTGREVLREVCAMLRARPAFGRESDPPIVAEGDTLRARLKPVAQGSLTLEGTANE